MVHVPRLGAVEQDGDARALELLHEVVVHGSAREEGGHGDSARSLSAIGDDHASDAIRHGCGSLQCEPVERPLEPRGALIDVVGGVKDATGPAHVVHGLDRLHLLDGEQRGP